MKLGWVTVFSMGIASLAHAQLAAPHSTADPGSPASAALSSQAAEALVRGNPRDALPAANNAIAADAHNPWAHYDKAAALSDLGQVDAAVAEFRAAEQWFSPADAWGRSVAIYGRANALSQAGRCPDAQAAFEEYAHFVEGSDPHGAALARDYAKQCIARPR